MCAFMELERAPSGDLVAALRDGGLPAVREMAHGCPACILSAILLDRHERGVNLRTMESEEADAEIARYAAFDFKKESAELFAAEYNREQPDA